MLRSPEQTLSIGTYEPAVEVQAEARAAEWLVRRRSCWNMKLLKPDPCYGTVPWVLRGAYLGVEGPQCLQWLA